MAQALPLHLHLTHTPPTVATSSSESKNTKETSHPSGGGSDDPGHLASLTLLPSEFSTGSYGWKSAKRITIELTDPESGSKRKVQVMINVNATVVGSKDAPRGEDSDAVAVGEASAEAEDEAEEEAELEEK